MSDNFVGEPGGVRMQVQELGLLVDRTHYTSRDFQITRPRPGQNGQMTTKVWSQGGAYNPRDWSWVGIDDVSGDPDEPYPRLFAGWMRTNPMVENSINLAYKLDCVDYNWRFANSPAMPIVKQRIGAPPVWLRDHPYAVGDVVQPYPSILHKYTCSRAGTSGTKQPSFSTVGASVTTEPWEHTINTPVEVGDICRPAIPNGWSYVCEVAGTTHSSPPTFPTTENSTVTETGGVKWRISRADSTYPQWTESGTSLVSDLECVNDILDIYFPQELFPHTRGSMHSLIAAVQSIEIQEDWTAEQALNAVSASASSTEYYGIYDAWLAAHEYAVGDYIEPTVPNGFIYMAAELMGTAPFVSGGAQPTWPTVVGQTVNDNDIKWMCVSRLGRWEQSVPMVAGQRIEPEFLARNGYYYDVVIPGTTASSPPIWGTTPTLGTTIVSGTVTFVVAGRTQVSPFFQWRIPLDNAAHTASWDPDFWWADLNSEDVGAGIEVYDLEYTDEPEELEPVFPDTPGNRRLSSIEITRDGNGFANAWLVFGLNGSSAYVADTQSIDFYNGFVVCRTHIATDEDGPRTPSECYALGTQLLSISIMQETVRATSRRPLSERMIKQVGFGKFTNNLMGLNRERYPLTNVQMSLSQYGSEYTIEAGSQLRTGNESLANQKTFGREFAVDRVPPDPVRWIIDDDDPNYWILTNVADNVNGAVTFGAQWMSSRETDLWMFVGHYDIDGQSYPFNVMWPTQHITIHGLPNDKDIQFRVSAIDQRGNQLRNPDGSVYWSYSPVVRTASIVRPTAPINLEVLDWQWPAELVARPLLTWDPTYVLPTEGAFWRIRMWPTSDDVVTVDVDGLTDTVWWPYYLNVGETYSWSVQPMLALMPGYESDPELIDPVPEWTQPAGPIVGLKTQGYTAGRYWCKVTISYAGDHSGGGFGRIKPSGHGGIEQIIMIREGAPFPYTIRFDNLAPQAYDLFFGVEDRLHRPSQTTTDSITIRPIPIKPPPPIWRDRSDEFDTDQGTFLDPHGPGGGGDYALIDTEKYAGSEVMRVQSDNLGTAVMKMIPEQYSIVEGDVPAIKFAVKGIPPFFGFTPTSYLDLVYFDDSDTEVGRVNVYSGVPNSGTWDLIEVQLDDPATEMPPAGTSYAMVSFGTDSSSEAVMFSKPDFAVVKKIVDLNIKPTPSEPFPMSDENGDPVAAYYWSPGAHKWVFVPLVNPTYTDLGYSFRDGSGAQLDMQGGSGSYSGNFDVIGSFDVGGSTELQNLDVHGLPAFDHALELKEIAAPATPISGWGRIYVKSSDSLLYFKNDAGTEFGLTFTGIAAIGVTAPITSTGGTSPTIGISAATALLPGSMSASDKGKLDNAVSANTGNRLVIRDIAGRAQFTDPNTAQDAATKNYVDNGDAASIAKSIGTTKGDVIGFSASGVYGRIGIGSNDQVLTADSAQTFGIKWATPPIQTLYQDYASTAYTEASDPTSDTTVKRNNGSTAMGFSIVLAATKNVRFRYYERIDKSPSSSGRSRFSIYNGSSQILPDVGGRISFNSVPVVDNEQFVEFEAVLSMASGTHAITVRHQATYTTTAIIHWERCLTAEVLN